MSNPSRKVGSEVALQLFSIVPPNVKRSRLVMALSRDVAVVKRRICFHAPKVGGSLDDNFECRIINLLGIGERGGVVGPHSGICLAFCPIV
jgi:hypothetical protein